MMNDFLYNKILMIPAILIAFTFHEYAHAIVADRLGDKTPRFQGRLTLNPAEHIDPIGFILVLAFGFGWAKPVQTNPSAYKNFHKDDLKVSLAGPAANFFVAIIAAVIFGIFSAVFYDVLPYALSIVLYNMIKYTIVINVNIGLFNLIPIPGLDGFHILRDMFPDTFFRYEQKIYEYQMLLMMLLVFAGGRIISIPANIIYRSLMNLAMSIAGIF